MIDTYRYEPYTESLCFSFVATTIPNNQGEYPVTRYLRYELGPDSYIYLEIDEATADEEGIVDVSIDETTARVVTVANDYFDTALDGIRNSADVLIRKLQLTETKPDEIEVQFGIKAAGEIGGFAIAKIGAEANYTVKMVWRNQTTAR